MAALSSSLPPKPYPTSGPILPHFSFFDTLNCFDMSLIPLLIRLAFCPAQLRSITGASSGMGKIVYAYSEATVRKISIVTFPNGFFFLRFKLLQKIATDDILVRSLFQPPLKASWRHLSCREVANLSHLVMYKAIVAFLLTAWKWSRL
jgi:hypothetical protein